MPPSELDFGIMCSGFEFDDWQAKCIKHLRQVEGVNLKILIVDGSDSPDTSGLRGKLSAFNEYRDRTSTKDAINRAAWWSYRRSFDTPPCRSKVNLSTELESIDSITCDVKEKGFSQYFYNDDLKKIEEYDLDFVLRMGFGIIRGEILDIPKYGVWSYHHGDERKYRGRPACFWEIYEGDPITGAILQRLTDELDGGVILKRGFFGTQRRYHDNLNQVYYGATEWPAQVATDILNGNADYINDSPTESDAPIYRVPSPVQITSYNLKSATSLATAVLSGINSWNVGVLQHSIEESIEESFTPEVEWFTHRRKDGFIADPFPITIDGTTYIFVEDFSYTDQKGKISYMEYPDGFKNGDLRTAHEEPEHMSYPYLFKHNDLVYATPEIHESNEIRLYRIHSPSDWEPRTSLVEDIEGIDPTIIKHEDKWWMFYTEQPYPNTKLYIRFAEELTGEWKPHKKNPVKTDVRSSRPAGTPFVKDGELYRPAQNSTGGYGKEIVINKVEELNPEQYIETKVSEVRPSEEGPNTGVHTLSSQGDITLIDGKRKVKNGHAVRRRFNQILSRLT